MRLNVELDEELIAEAEHLTGLRGASLIEAALRTLISSESARRLALLGGTMPDVFAPPRRRFPPDAP